MPKQPDRVQRDFTFATDADLNAQIAAYRAEYEAGHPQGLAMDARYSLGPGKVRIAFRLVDKRPTKKR